MKISMGWLFQCDGCMTVSDQDAHASPVGRQDILYVRLNGASTYELSICSDCREKLNIDESIRCIALHLHEYHEDIEDDEDTAQNLLQNTLKSLTKLLSATKSEIISDG